MSVRIAQNKQSEAAFFNEYAKPEGYDVFEQTSTRKLVDTCIQLAGWEQGGLIADLGCGSGVFTSLLAANGFKTLGLDLSHKLLVSGGVRSPHLQFMAGDVEFLPLRSESLDGVLLSGILHHLPDPTHCVREVFRVLKPNGVVVTFDPNRLNPFMWLYRDRSSPFYSSKGVTANERPILSSALMEVFSKQGFCVSVSYLSGLHYRYVASTFGRFLLPLYNKVDDYLFRLSFLKPFSAFVLARGLKSAG